MPGSSGSSGGSGGSGGSDGASSARASIISESAAPPSELAYLTLVLLKAGHLHCTCTL